MSHPSASVRQLQQQIFLRHPHRDNDAPESVAGRPARRASAKRRRVAPDEDDELEEDSLMDADSDSEHLEEDDEGAPPSGKKGRATSKSGAHVSPAEAKRLRRQQQNRDAAATSRNRKKAYLTSLEQKNDRLQAENDKLRQHAKEMAREIAQLRLQLEGRASVLPQQPTPFAMHDLSVVDSPLTPSSEVHSSAPTSPMSQHDFSSAASTTSHSSASRQSAESTRITPRTHRQQAPRARTVRPLEVTVAPIQIDLAEADTLPPLSSPRLHKLASVEQSLHFFSDIPVEPASSSVDDLMLITHHMELDPTMAGGPYGTVFQANLPHLHHAAELVSQRARSASPTSSPFALASSTHSSHPPVRHSSVPTVSPLHLAPSSASPSSLAGGRAVVIPAVNVDLPCHSTTTTREATSMESQHEAQMPRAASPHPERMDDDLSASQCTMMLAAAAMRDACSTQHQQWLWLWHASMMMSTAAAWVMANVAASTAATMKATTGTTWNTTNTQPNWPTTC